MYYLIKRAPGSAGKVKAVYEELNFPINGFRVVEVPDDVVIDESDVNTPSWLTYDDVVRQKYEGILANNPLFENIFYDDLTAPSEFDNSTTIGGGVGDGILWLEPGGSLEAEITLGGFYDRFAAYWDIYELERTTDGRRNDVQYRKKGPDMDGFNVSISTDGGSSFTDLLFMDRTPTASEGNQVVLRLENITTDRLYLGGLAILY